MQKPRKWTRRQFVRTAGMAVPTAGLLLACGRDDQEDSAGDTAPTASASPSESGGGGSTPAASAPAVSRALSEWHVVTPHKTGGADPLSEYPTNAQYYLPWHVMEPLFYPALAEDGKSWTLVNELAKEWRFADPQTLEVQLEEGVMFHNGEELTAEHVKRAYDAIISADPPIRRTAVLKPLGEAEVVDQHTIRWHMPEPNIAVLGAMYTLLIPPLARYEMSAEEFEREPIGTGPYRVVSWPRDGVVELEAWSDYRKGKVHPERIIGREVPDPSTRLFELISGSAHVAHSLTVEALKELQGNPDYELTSLKGAYLVANVINLFKSDPPLNDKRVRQAMNFAIDREAIVAAILEGYGVPLPGPLSPGWLGFGPTHTTYPYDPERAKQLLAEAGISGFTFSLQVPPGQNKNVEVAQAVASQLSQVGITVNVEPIETARLLANRSEGNYDVTTLNFGITWMPTTLFQFTLYTSLPDDKLSPIWGETPEVLKQVRDLYAEAAAVTDLDAFDMNLRAVHELMHEEAFWLYVYSADDLWGVRKDIGYRPFPTVYHRWYDEWTRRGMTLPANPAVPLVFE